MDGIEGESERANDKGKKERKKEKEKWLKTKGKREGGRYE